MKVTLVAVHGNGGGAFRFERVLPFVPHDIRFRAVTLPGFASEPRDPTLRTMGEYAARLHEMIAPEPRPLIVLGHGIGGAFVLELIQQHANAIDSVMLHAPVGTRLESRGFPKLMALPGARAFGQWLFSSRLARPAFRRLLFSQAVPRAYADRFFDEYRHCAVFAQMFEIITADWFQRLRPSDVPAALLWGGRERVLSVDHVRDYRALLPNSTTRIVPEWGHFPMIEQPEAYALEVAGLARGLARWVGERVTG